MDTAEDISVTANHAYLNEEAAQSNKNILLFPNDLNSIKEVTNNNKEVNVYNLNGVLVRKNVRKENALQGLENNPNRVYIVDGEKVLK